MPRKILSQNNCSDPAVWCKIPTNCNLTQATTDNDASPSWASQNWQDTECVRKLNRSCLVLSLALTVSNSCNACRQSKIKCSGKHPCQSCQRRSVRCHFTDTGQKVVVSGKYLEDLQRRAERQQLSPPRRRRGPQVGSNECLEQNLPDVALLELQSVRTASPHRIAGCCNLRRPDRSIVEDEHAIQGVDRPTHRRVLASPPSTSEGISKSHHEGGRVLSRDMESENESHLRTDSLVIRSRVIENLKANRRKWSKCLETFWRRLNVTAYGITYWQFGYLRGRLGPLPSVSCSR